MNGSRRFAAFAAFAACAVLTLGAVLPLSSPARADEALTVLSSDVTAYPDVRLVVTAPAQLGDVVLTDSAFQVVEAGKRLPARVEPLAPEQLDVALVIDTSGSMAGAPLAGAKTAARSFLAQLPDAVRVSVIGFGATPTVVSAPSPDRAATLAAIARLTAGGETALYDAMGTALSQLPAGTGHRPVVVLLTDGGDTASTATLESTTHALAAAKVPLFAVELQTSESNPAALRQLTTASAGAALSASDPAALAGAFDSVARQLVRQYAVTYRSQAHGSTDVDVVLDAQGVTATARRHLELPSGAGGASGAAGAGAGAGGDSGTSAPLGSWALVAGGALCGAAMLVLGMALLASRTPRARGLAARQRSLGLAGAADRAEALSDSVLRHRGGIAAVSGALDTAGIDIRPGEFVIGVVVADVVALVAGWVLLAPFVGLLLAVAVPFGARFGLDVLARRRRTRFSDQLAETLQILAGSLRAGHGLAQGIETVAREAESPTAEEFRRLTIETRLGSDFVDALAALGARIGGEDFEWVVQAIQIQREVGGDLAEILDTVAGTIRDRTRVRRQVSALSAEGKISAWVLVILPFGMAAVMFVTNPDYLRPLFESGTGQKFIAVAAALLVAGALWLRRIVKPIF